ncbi:hypothetical protein N7510_007763 [Penicillium lagena]|uniref:uncharacterized protein n=1 Tax=Penicillium lagena TaxID=94218 RepID=UPI00254227F8|nr:uncharacterized protein N7510_007763 [Penicillium lagena]KAJ5611044.1 hypothetical protein N7510_007763 [Penicillium lagena]
MGGQKRPLLTPPLTLHVGRARCLDSLLDRCPFVPQPHPPPGGEPKMAPLLTVQLLSLSSIKIDHHAPLTDSPAWLSSNSSSPRPGFPTGDLLQ